MYQVTDYITSPESIVDRLLRGFEANMGPYPPPEKLILTRWTEAVKTVLRDFGKELGEEVYCSGCGPNYGEYLVDVLWFNTATARPDVVFECEWGNIDCVRYDFEKLIYMKAPMKIMICDPQTERAKLLPKLEESLHKYPDHLAGEKYLVLDVRGHHTGGNSDCHVWTAPSNGKQLGAAFTILEGSPFRYELRKRGAL